MYEEMELPKGKVFLLRTSRLVSGRFKIWNLWFTFRIQGPGHYILLAPCLLLISGVFSGRWVWEWDKEPGNISPSRDIVVQPGWRDGGMVGEKGRWRRACTRLKDKKEMVKLGSTQSRWGGRAVFVGWYVSFDVKLVGSWREAFDYRHIKARERD